MASSVTRDQENDQQPDDVEKMSDRDQENDQRSAAPSVSHRFAPSGLTHVCVIDSVRINNRCVRIRCISEIIVLWNFLFCIFVVNKTELDKYLGEDREAMDVNFDILKWWGINKCRYPVLSKMARDVLAISVSSVASESAFSTGGRVLDSFRTSLTPRMVEALVCTQDWVRDCHDPINVDDILLEIEKLEEESLKDLTVDQPTIIIDETFEFSDLYVTIRIRIRNFGYPEFRISEISDSDSDSNIQFPKVSDI
ncbi:hypothetical protein LXL04_022645 [Taraxacum kok-saghyz]